MIDLIGKRNYFFGLSIIIILIGVVAYFINGLHLDIQFKGGSIVDIQIENGIYNTTKAEKVAAKAVEVVKKSINMDATAQISQTVDPDSDKKIEMLSVSISSALTEDQQNKLFTALRGEKECYVKANANISVNNVQPFIGREILNKGLLAVFWASLLIILYIWWRFQVMSGLSAGIMAVIALLHDILIMLAVYVIFKIPMNEAFIAAVLTVLGYSMNDTIIIYDRIRENSNLLRKVPVAELVNKSIIQTLNRSINTVLTVVICIVTVYVFASINNIQTIKDFALPLIIGISSGCYSSIFIASPLWVMWRQFQSKKKVTSKPANA